MCCLYNTKWSRFNFLVNTGEIPQSSTSTIFALPVRRILNFFCPEHLIRLKYRAALFIALTHNKIVKSFS